MTRDSASAPAQDPIAPLLAALESALEGVHQALVQQDSQALEQHSQAVQGLMSDALAQARDGHLSLPLRQRLAQAGAQMAAHRVSLSRASTALDRAIDVLMPAESIGLYGEAGKTLKRRSSGGGVSA